MAGNEWLRRIRFLYHYWLEYATVPRLACGSHQTSGRPLPTSVQLEETLLFDGRAFDLSANRYPAVVHPQGFRYLKEFRLDPFPVFTYEIEGIEIEKTVFMVHGENSTIIQYQLGNVGGSKSVSEQITLELRPLIEFQVVDGEHSRHRQQKQTEEQDNLFYGHFGISN
jgi:predicted glycogen debranching enzyme